MGCGATSSALGRCHEQTFPFPLSPLALQEVGTKILGGVEIACLEMGEVPKDRVRAPFLAVGDWNGNVKILGLSPENLLEQVRFSGGRDFLLIAGEA